jgi:ribosomal protein S27AE
VRERGFRPRRHGPRHRSLGKTAIPRIWNLIKESLVNYDPKNCSNCGGTFHEGFLFDHTHSGAAAGVWQADAPQKSFWTGIRAEKHKQHPIKALRCDRCGLLQLFAR